MFRLISDHNFSGRILRGVSRRIKEILMKHALWTSLWIVFILCHGLRGDDLSWKTHLEAGTKAYQQAHYREAERQFGAALKMAESFGEKDARLGMTLVNLAEVHLKQGRLGEADRLCLRARQLIEKAQGSEHPDYARCLNDLAEISRALGFYSDTEGLARTALAIREKALGKNHPDVAQSVDTLASIGEAYEPLISEPGRHVSRAMSLKERSLGIREKAFDKDHPNLIPSLLTLTAENLRGSMSRPPETVTDLRRAMDLVRKTEEEDHPDMAECLTLLARIHREQEKYRLAEEAQQRALAIWRKSLGPEHPRVGYGLLNLGAIYLDQGRVTEAEALFFEALKDHFTGLSDEELCQYGRRSKLQEYYLFDTAEAGEKALNHREAYLTEMVRRGGPTIGAFLNIQDSLDGLSARRRVQGKPDPLTICVKGAAQRECHFPNLPDFEVTLKNVDVEKKPMRIMNGGDYRTGRQARWRFEVRDHRGQLLQIKGPPSCTGGGLCSAATLEFDETWDTTLHMRSFIDLVPGDYTLRIQYHNRLTIADMKATAGLILVQSEPLHLHVQPRVIDLTKQEREEAKKWLAKLDENAGLRILAGRYGKGAHDFIEPDSPPGRLLTLNWKAVPVLLESATDNKLTPARRAWVLALLFSITGYNDPRFATGVVGSYSDRGGSWQIWGGLDGKMTSGGFGYSGSGFCWGGEIDVAKQQEFAKKWQAFKDYIVVRER